MKLLILLPASPNDVTLILKILALFLAKAQGANRLKNPTEFGWVLVEEERGLIRKHSGFFSFSFKCLEQIAKDLKQSMWKTELKIFCSKEDLSVVSLLPSISPGFFDFFSNCLQAKSKMLIYLNTFEFTDCEFLVVSLTDFTEYSDECFLILENSCTDDVKAKSNPGTILKMIREFRLLESSPQPNYCIFLENTSSKQVQSSLAASPPTNKSIAVESLIDFFDSFISDNSSDIENFIITLSEYKENLKSILSSSTQTTKNDTCDLFRYLNLLYNQTKSIVQEYSVQNMRENYSPETIMRNVQLQMVLLLELYRSVNIQLKAKSLFDFPLEEVNKFISDTCEYLLDYLVMQYAVSFDDQNKSFLSEVDFIERILKHRRYFELGKKRKSKITMFLQNSCINRFRTECCLKSPVRQVHKRRKRIIDKKESKKPVPEVDDNLLKPIGNLKVIKATALGHISSIEPEIPKEVRKNTANLLSINMKPSNLFYKTKTPMKNRHGIRINQLEEDNPFLDAEE